MQDVFTSEQANDGVMILSLCVMDCFDLAANRSGQLARSLVAPYWVGDVGPATLLAACFGNNGRVVSAVNTSQFFEAFSMNLLFAELKLRRCDRQPLETDDMDSDAPAVSYLVSTLIEVTKTWNRSNILASETIDNQITWMSLQTRTHWLASCYYLRWSRSSDITSVSSNVEQLALEHLDKAVLCLEKPTTRPIKVILTPHLESPSRLGKHWKELSKSNLVAYKNEIQAASVVSRARLQFMDIRNRIQIASSESDGGGVTLVVDKEYRHLQEIGRDLLARYDYEYKDHGERHEELVRDFLFSRCIRDMFLEANRERTQGRANSFDHASIGNTSRVATNSLQNSCIIKWGEKLWETIPSSLDSAKMQLSANSQHPSIIEILTICCIQVTDLLIPLLQLFVRLVLSAFEQRSKIMAVQAKTTRSQSNSCTPSFFSDEDNFSDSSDEDVSDSEGSNLAKEEGKVKSEHLLVLVAEFLMDKISHLFTYAASTSEILGLPPSELQDFTSSAELLSILQISLSVASESRDLEESSPISKRESGSDALETVLMFHPNARRSSSVPSRRSIRLPDKEMLWTSHNLITSLLSKFQREDCEPHALESAIFTLLSKIITEEQHSLASLLSQRGDRRSRSTKQRLCLAKGDLVGDAAVMFADLLMRFPFKLLNGFLLPSSIIQSLRGPVDVSSENESSRLGSSSFELTPLIKIFESLLWFWKYLSKNGAADAGCTVVRAADSTTDKSIARKLETPIAAAIIALCGSAGNSGALHVINSIESNSLSDVYDSGDSGFDSMEYSSNEDEKDENTLNNIAAPKWRLLIRALSHIVKGTSAMFGKVKDRNACLIIAPISGLHGPLLPLVVSRMMNNIAEILLGNFQEKITSALLAEEYPRGVRTTGLEIDTLLAKAYNCLHGFALSLHSGKEINQLGASHDASKHVFFPPESAKAALSLYRLLKRTYPSNGRRVIPKAALECVSKSMPVMKETSRSKSIHNFVFSNPFYVSLDSINLATFCFCLDSFRNI